MIPSTKKDEGNPPVATLTSPTTRIIKVIGRKTIRNTLFEFINLVDCSGFYNDFGFFEKITYWSDFREL